jgi:hypothetical protein
VPRNVKDNSSNNNGILATTIIVVEINRVVHNALQVPPIADRSVLHKTNPAALAVIPLRERRINFYSSTPIAR